MGRSNQRMFLFSLLLLFLLINALTAATSNNPDKTATRLHINCGTAATSTALNGRVWIGDVQPKGSSSSIQIKGSSTASTVARNSISSDQVPHNTARISPSRFSYEFRVSPGEKILRLHFNPVPYKGFKRFKDLFNVEAGPFTLLGNFSASLTAAALGVRTLAKEFCVSIAQNQIMSLTFSTVASHVGDTTYAFINGIEINAVPLRLSYFKGGDRRAQVVGRKSLVYIDNSTALELTHRVNLKQDYGSFSDEFDDEDKGNGINGLTWKKPLDVGFRYLIRIHFCNLGLRSANLKVLVDEMIVDDNISSQQDNEYGNLKYRDYVVSVKGRKEEGRRDLSISLQSHDEFVHGDQLIKGVEIFKLSSHENSLAGANNAFPPPQRESPSRMISNLLPIIFQNNITATRAIAILAFINVIFHKLREIREARSTTKQEENRPSAKAEQRCRRFSLDEMKTATKNFCEALLIGKGGFGNVYEGVIDNGRETVAIKRLKANSTQGKHEFLTEIETLCELWHINLVSLIGFCNDHKEMILVYEYMPGGTMADHLFKYAREGNGSCSLTWKQRLNICIGSARGLDYLHTGNRVIHRDVKASNILLDGNLVAKVSDFGLAKPEDRSKSQSHISTKVKGTYGYMDPYYFSTRKLTRKSDTYAFGVVLLEVLCERQATDSRFGGDEHCLTRWARKKIKDGEVNEIVASSLLEEILPESLKVFVEVAERCLHDEPKKRPTMAQIVVQLQCALEHQDMIVEADHHVALVASDIDVCPSMEQTISNHFPGGQNEWRGTKLHKPSSWALAALLSKFKSSKRRDIYLASEICEADIRVPKFDFAIVSAATDNFSSSHKIGEGEFATVYKAVLPTGRTLAVKIYKLPVPWLKNAILSLSSLRHQNIIQLHGYCIHEETGVLLYEFMQNGSLDRFIFDEERRCQLQWSVRIKVIIGIARGVIYLHQESNPKTIHRDLNPTNILLDNEMNPIISGSGTIGCITPEHVGTRRISEKIDVYSFGVLVLEILSGKRNNGEYLDDYAWKVWNDGVRNVFDLVDESVGGGEFSEDEALICFQTGLLCTQYEPQQRPTMRCALKMLLGEDLSLQTR